MKTQKLINVISCAVVARNNCINSCNWHWRDIWESRLDDLTKLLPSGSGFDSGCKIDIDESNAFKVIVSTAFHHMNGNGFYDGWTEHRLIIKPSFISVIDITVTGRNRSDIKDYIAEMFYHVLTQEVETW